jgi:hypothetical protein
VSGARGGGFKIPDSRFKTACCVYPRLARTGLGFLARRGARSLGGAVLAGCLSKETLVRASCKSRRKA